MRILTIVLFSLFSLTACAQNTKALKQFDQANVELEKGNKDKALACLNKAIKIDPNYADAWSLKAYIYEKNHDSTNACKCYRMAIKADPLYQNTYYYYAKYLYELEEYDQAMALLAKFHAIAKDPKFDKKKDGASAKLQKDADKLGESCKFAKEEAARAAVLNIKNMGPGINSANWEYWPGMTIDGKYFIVTRLMTDQEDFYISLRTDTGWSLAQPLPGKINTPDNEGTSSVTPDGRFIFFTVCNQDGFGSCDLFYSYYTPSTGQWGKRMNMGKEINSTQWDATPAISADGKSIIFSSARDGGYGGKDLYISHFANGKWTTPENLGKTINTADDEEAPFLHYDGRTLYFSSNGHPGLGGHDLFLTRKGADGEWQTPVNLGKGINTDADERGLYVEYKGEKAYFSSNRPGGFGGVDIYSFDLAPDKRPGPISYVLGKVIDEELKQDLTARIVVTDLKTNTVVLSDSSFSFFTTLEPGGNYGLNVYRKGYLFYSANFQPTAGSIDSPFVVTAMLKAIKSDETIVLNNIFFDVDKYDLKSESYAELDKVLALLRANPAMTIAIEGHTDNTGSADHNQVLSENRAKSVMQYLVSKGINAKRVTAKGFGATRPQPDADNATEQGRARNRRIEMRVTSL